MGIWRLGVGLRVEIFANKVAIGYYSFPVTAFLQSSQNYRTRAGCLLLLLLLILLPRAEQFPMFAQLWWQRKEPRVVRTANADRTTRTAGNRKLASLCTVPTKTGEKGEQKGLKGKSKAAHSATCVVFKTQPALVSGHK